MRTFQASRKYWMVGVAALGGLGVVLLVGCGSTYGGKGDHEIPKDPAPLNPPPESGPRPQPNPEPPPKPGQPYAKPRG